MLVWEENFEDRFSCVGSPRRVRQHALYRECPTVKLSRAKGISALARVAEIAEFEIGPAVLWSTPRWFNEWRDPVDETRTISIACLR
jgi:hypothetical protein